MIKKILLIFFTLFVTNLSVFAYTAHLPKGSLVKVYTKIPLNTQNLEEGSKVYFIVPADVWVLEERIIEKGDIFKGYVSMLKMPSKGINAAMQITIDTIVKKDGRTKKIKGEIIFNSERTLGGNLTNPASYNTTIHPRKVYGDPWGGSLQYVPSGDWEFGHHVGITSKDNIFVQFNEDYYI